MGAIHSEGSARSCIEDGDDIDGKYVSTRLL